MDQWIGAASAVIRELYTNVVKKRKLSQQPNPSIFQPSPMISGKEYS